jgi:hypothetical protein
MLAWGEADLDQRGDEAFVLVFWASTEPVESLLKEPVLARFADWAARSRTGDNNLVIRMDRVAECVLAVTLFLYAATLDCHCCKEAIAFLSDDGSVDVALGPDCFFMVA